VLRLDLREHRDDPAVREVVLHQFMILDNSYPTFFGRLFDRVGEMQKSSKDVGGTWGRVRLDGHTLVIETAPARPVPAEARIDKNDSRLPWKPASRFNVEL
jgi:hypothetical protein